MSDRLPRIKVDNLLVTFATLHKPDEHFGRDNASHNVTVRITPELQAEIDRCCEELGVTKVSGLGVEKGTGDPTIKVKSTFRCHRRNDDGSKTFIEGAKFPHVGRDGHETEMTASSSDIVNLILTPKRIERPSRQVALYLEAIQIVEKNSEYGRGDAGGASAFDALEPVGGSSDDEIPF